MSGTLRKDVDFKALFRKLGHDLSEIRVRALENILSKLEHGLICEEDVIHEKLLYIRLLEWFNIKSSSHKAEVLSLLNRLSQHSSGAELLQDIGGVEFFSQLRSDIEPCHRPNIDQILDNIFRLPDTDGQEHAPECIYMRPSDSAVWGASVSSIGDGSKSYNASHNSDYHRASLTNFDKPTPHPFTKQSYFVNPHPEDDQRAAMSNTETFHTGTPFWTPFGYKAGEQEANLFRLSTFPWQPLTQTDQQVIASTNGSLQAKEPGLLISACEFLADVVFQDFPAEIFLQRPEILKSLLSLVSLPSPSDVGVAVQACQALTSYIRCLQARIRFFQDPAFYTSKQEFNSSTPSMTSSTSSSSQRISGVGNLNTLIGWDGKRLRGDGQDGDSSASASRESSIGLEPDSNINDDFDLDDGPQLQSQQLTLPQLCVAILQRAIPRLQTSTQALGVAALELIQETLTVLVCVIDEEVWSEASESVRDVADRLIDCLEILAELLAYHHHSRHAVSPIDADLGDLSTHRILYMGLVSFTTKFLTVVPLEKMKSVIPEKLKSALCAVVYDGALALTFPEPRSVALAITQRLDLSTGVDFSHVVTVCRSLTKTCNFCLHWEDGITAAPELANQAEEAILSLQYNLYLPFVERFLRFFSRVCSKKKTAKPVIAQCTEVLLKLMAYPLEEVRTVCYSSMGDILKESLQVSQATAPRSKESLKVRFVLHHDVLYQVVCFGMADGNKSVQNSAHGCILHLLASQLLMSEALWQELIMALSKCLPVLQSYTDQKTLLGRRLWAMLDPTSTTHNLPLLDKIRGSLRLLFLSDKSLRLQSAKHLKWFLCNEQNKDSKLPSPVDLDINVIESAFITKTTQFVDEDNSRSVFTEEGMKQVYNIFTSDPVDEGVKRSAGEQLAIMMKDPHLHSAFRAMGGVDAVTCLINQALNIPHKQSDQQNMSFLPACLSMLKNVIHHDYSLRHCFARDHDLYYSLIRAMLTNLDKEEVKADVCHILVLLLFDEVAKFDISHGQADQPGTKFSLPHEVIQRYRLPFKPSCHHIASPHMVTLPDTETDVMTLNGPQQMMRIAWNLAWQGGLELLLDSFNTQLFSETKNEFNSVLRLSPIDCTVLEISSVSWKLLSLHKSIKTAASHEDVLRAVDVMWQYCTVFKVPGLVEFFSNTDWHTSLERFISVSPSSASDQLLLSHILRFLNSSVSCVSPRQWGHGSTPNPVLSWLTDKLFAPGTSISTLIARPSVGASDRHESSLQRNLDKELIRFLTAIHCRLPYQLCFRPRPGMCRGSLVKRLQDHLNITDAPHFYNLASLEGALTCLMHVTARPGWSKECESLDATTLCSQLLNSLLEVVWSFHIGRGGTSKSFMGKGVTKSSTLCLRHLAYEMALNSEDPSWVKNWLYSRQDTKTELDQGLNWLLTLWAYRDAEVRAAGVGIAVAMTSTEASRLLVTSNCKHIPGGLWGASFSIMLDPQECSIVCEQAALLLVNLTSQPMSSGDVETVTGSTWQGPLVTDADYQVMLVGTKALEVLIEHTNLYAVVSECIASWYAPALIQPILVTIETPLAFETTSSTSTGTLTANSSIDGVSLDKTEATLLTSVSSMSGHPTPNLTAKTASSDKSKSSTSSQSSSSQVHMPTALHSEQQGTRQRNTTPEPMPSVQGQNIASSSMMAAMVKLMTNVVTLTPHRSIAAMRAHSIISGLLSMVKPSLVHDFCTALTTGQVDSSTALALRDVLSLYSSIADLLRTCVTMDTNSRMELLSSQTGMESLMSLLLLQWPGGKDDIGDSFATAYVSVLRLFSSLLQKQGSATLEAVSPILGPQWSSLADSLCTMLDDSSPSRLTPHLAALDFVALLCCGEAKSLVKNPDRFMKEASVSELLDFPLGNDSVGEKEDKECSTTGKTLCKVLISAFEIINSSSREERSTAENERRLKVISTLKSLLIISQSAKVLALESGVAESLVEHIKQTHAQLTLETLGLGKGKGKKEEPFIQELSLIFDLLKNFMFKNSDVKLACHHSGLTGVILRLWAWCLQDSGLLANTLSLLISFTANCNSAASSFTASMSVSSVNVKAGGQTNCLLNSIVKLSQREINRDECSPTLRQLFTLLSNVAVNSECRNLLWKSPFLQQVSHINPRRNRAKLQVAMDTLWCELLLSISFTTDGHQIILKIPDILTVLMDLMGAGSSRCQHCATLIVRNLCCHAPNKPKLLASDNFVNCLVRKIEESNEPQNQLMASSALWALVHNNHKARVQVKSANVSSSIMETLQDILPEGQRSSITMATVENLRCVMAAIRE